MLCHLPVILKMVLVFMNLSMVQHQTLPVKVLPNPISMILSVAMMLRESFNETEGAELIENAVDKTLNQGILTRDLGGQASTAEMTAAIISNL